jgi:hypothetical protein
MKPLTGVSDRLILAEDRERTMTLDASDRLADQSYRPEFLIKQTSQRLSASVVLHDEFSQSEEIVYNHKQVPSDSSYAGPIPEPYEAAILNLLVRAPIKA